MPANEDRHIHIYIEGDDLKVDRVFTGVNPAPTENLCTVGLTNKEEEGYDPVFGDWDEVVIEATEARLEADNEGNFVMIFGI